MNPIVGIGEILWDVYPDRKVAGGAPFNFAYHCHQLGHPAVIVSRVGDDDLGRELRARVRELGLSDEYIQTDRDHPTGTVQVTLDANAVPTYTITENVAWDWIEWEPRLTLLREFAPAAVFGTLAQRNWCSAQTIHEFVIHVGSLFRVMDMNLRPTACGIPWRTNVDRAAWVKLNVDEVRFLAEAWAKVPPGQAFDIWVLKPWLHSKTIIVTGGERGCSVFPSFSYEPHFSEPGVPAKVVDTVGAGDAFTAAMVCLHLEGCPLRECARFANHYAARVCEHPGGTPKIDRADVELQAFGRRPR